MSDESHDESVPDLCQDMDRPLNRVWEWTVTYPGMLAVMLVIPGVLLYGLTVAVIGLFFSRTLAARIQDAVPGILFYGVLYGFIGWMCYAGVLWLFIKMVRGLRR